VLGNGRATTSAIVVKAKVRARGTTRAKPESESRAPA